MSGLLLRHVLVAAVSSVLAPAALGSPFLAQEPIYCAPCTPEKMNECPALSPGCAEALRKPGCGCCLACALQAGDFCGIHTAPCGSGLRCTPRLGDPRPLHSLTRGQALCTEITDNEQSKEPQNLDQDETDAETGNGATGMDTGASVYLPGHSKPFDPRAAADAQDSMKAKVNAIRKTLVEQSPCHIELQVALEKIAKSQQKMGDKMTRFYLPNCDKHGFYKAKQCESSLDGLKGKCWCVSSWNGKRIFGSSDLPRNSDCPTEMNH